MKSEMSSVGAVETSHDQSSVSAGPSGTEPLAPWGCRPTPLLPRWYRETLASLRLPTQITKRCKQGATVGDIDSFWDTARSPIAKVALDALVRLVRGYEPPFSYVIVPTGFDLAQLAYFPFRIRTMNCLRRGPLLDGTDGLTVGQVMSLPNFGIVSLLDMMCVTERALTCHSSPRDLVRVNQPVPDDPPWQSGAWRDLVDHLKLLLGGAAEFHGAVTVGDALRTDLAHLAKAIGIAPALDSVVIQELEADYRIADTVSERLATLMESMSRKELLIVNKRLFTDDPVSLKEVGLQAGVTRERIRQIQCRVQESVDETVGSEIGTIRKFVAEKIGPVVSSAEFESVVAGVFDDESSTEEATELARRILRSALDYSCLEGICLDQTATALVEALRQAAIELADDVGLIDEEALQGCLPSDEWVEFFPQMLERCGFPRIGGRLAGRDTGRARTKAALLDIGRAATKEEIAGIIGLDPNRVSSQLSAITSIARADKTRWGLLEWIDDVYEGIPAEIIQRINEDDGATSLERLVEELPRLFDVSETSVRAYVGTPQFTLRDGYVSLADDSSIALRGLNDVIDGRDANGDPYWTFAVENRYFDGYSLIGLPPELASELGCEPNGKTQAVIDHPTGCGDLSVIWRLASISGASLGYLAEPLRRLGVNDGDRVRVVIKGPGVVELHSASRSDLSDDHVTTSGESLLERIKNRRMVV